MTAAHRPATSDAEFPLTGRLAGVDYGTVRIGISVCDPMRILVSPLEIRLVSDPARDAEYFRQLAKSERIDGWVVGLPVHCDGGESEKSIEARRFGRWLAESTGLPVRLFDERFTTSAAQDRLRSARMSGLWGGAASGGGASGKRSGDRGRGGSGGSDRGQRSRKAGKRSRERLVDAVAAQVLLESFLEAQRYHSALPGQSPRGPEVGEASLEG